MRVKKRLGNFAITGISVVVSLLLCEFVVRVLPVKWTKIDYGLVDEERLFVSTRTYKFRPNLTRVWVGLGRPTVWHFNELGYRERAIQIKKPDNVFRIVFLGDSVVMGFGVEDYESLTRQLEDLLKAKEFNSKMTHFEVLNLAIQGYSTPEYLSVIEDDALRMKPDLLIIGLYANDFNEAMSYYVNQRYFKLKAIPDKIPYKLSNYMKEHSRLYLLLLGRYYSFVERYANDYQRTAESEDKEWAIVYSDLDRIDEILEKYGIEYAIVRIPHPQTEVAVEDGNAGVAGKLKEYVKSRGVNYFDMLEGLRLYPDTGKLYLDDYDDHFSIEGNRYAAELIGKYLIGEGLVPSQSGD